MRRGLSTFISIWITAAPAAQANTVVRTTIPRDFPVGGAASLPVDSITTESVAEIGLSLPVALEMPQEIQAPPPAVDLAVAAQHPMQARERMPDSPVQGTPLSPTAKASEQEAFEDAMRQHFAGLQDVLIEMHDGTASLQEQLQAHAPPGALQSKAAALFEGAGVRPERPLPTLWPESAEELPARTRLQKMVKIEGAQVGWMDQALLELYFPGLKGMSRGQIARWLVENFAYVTDLQARLEGIVTTPIPKGNSTATAYAQPGFGRSVDMVARSADGAAIGLMNTKGGGNTVVNADDVLSMKAKFDEAPDKEAARRELSIRSHSNGSVTFGEAVAELARQRAIQSEFDIHNRENGTDYQTNPILAVLVLPHDIVSGNDLNRAALILRVPTFGRTRSPRNDPFIKRYNNLQSTDLANVFTDYGDAPVTHPSLIRGFNGTGRWNSQYSPIAGKAYEAAKSFLSGRASAIEEFLSRELAPIASFLEQAPRRGSTTAGWKLRIMEMVRNPRVFSNIAAERVAALARSGAVNPTDYYWNVLAMRTLPRHARAILSALDGSARDMFTLALSKAGAEPAAGDDDAAIVRRLTDSSDQQVRMTAAGLLRDRAPRLSAKTISAVSRAALYDHNNIVRWKAAQALAARLDNPDARSALRELAGRPNEYEQVRRIAREALDKFS